MCGSPARLRGGRWSSRDDMRGRRRRVRVEWAPLLGQGRVPYRPTDTRTVPAAVAELLDLVIGEREVSYGGARFVEGEHSGSVGGGVSLCRPGVAARVQRGRSGNSRRQCSTNRSVGRNENEA